MKIKADDVGTQTEGVYEKDGKWFWMFQGKGAGPFNTEEEANEDLRNFNPKDIEGAEKACPICHKNYALSPCPDCGVEVCDDCMEGAHQCDQEDIDNYYQRDIEGKITNYKGFKIKTYEEDGKWTWGMPGTAESFGPGLPNMHETEKGALDEAKAYVEQAGDELKSSIKADEIDIEYYRLNKVDKEKLKKMQESGKYKFKDVSYDTDELEKEDKKKAQEKANEKIKKMKSEGWKQFVREDEGDNYINIIFYKIKASIKADASDQAFNEGLKKGIQVEKEHIGMLQKLKDYFDKNKTLPTDNAIYEWIASDHLKETPFYYGPEFEEFERLVKEKKDAASTPEEMNQTIANILRCNEIKAMLQDIDMNKVEAMAKKIKAYGYGMKLLREKAKDVADAIGDFEYHIETDLDQNENEIVLLMTENDPSVGIFGQPIADFESLEELIDWWRKNEKSIDAIWQRYDKDEISSEDMDKEIGKLKTAEKTEPTKKKVKGAKVMFGKTKDGWVVRMLSEEGDEYVAKYIDGPNIGKTVNIKKSEFEQIKSTLSRYIKGAVEVQSGDLEVGKAYSEDFLTDLGFQFGHETQDMVNIWEPDGDGWMAKKLPNGDFEIVKQSYEGTEEKKKMVEQVYSHKKIKAAIEQYLANAIKEYLAKQGRPTDMVEISRYDMNEIEAIVDNDIETFTYDELGVSHEEIEDLMAEPAIAKVKAFGPPDPKMEDDIDRRALRLGYRFKAEIKEIMRRYKNPLGQYDKAVKVITQILNER